MLYRIVGLEQLDLWRAGHPDDPRYPLLYELLAKLVEDPQMVGGTPVPRPGGGLPVYTAIVPGTDIAVAYVVYEHPPYPLAGVRLIEIGETR